MNTPIQRPTSQRNVGWIVGITIAAGVLVFAAAIVFFVFGLIKSSDAYQLGFAKASASPTVIAALGTPIEAGMFVSGSVKVSGPSGSAELSIPLHGPSGSGRVYLRAQKSLGEWTLTGLVFENESTHQRADLLKENVGTPASE